MYDIGATEINDFNMERFFIQEPQYILGSEPDCASCIYARVCDTAGEVKQCYNYYQKEMI